MLYFFLLLQAKIQPTYTSYAKHHIHIDDETIARDIANLNNVLKDTGLEDDQAKKYHGKWCVFILIAVLLGCKLFYFGFYKEPSYKDNYGSFLNLQIQTDYMYLYIFEKYSQLLVNEHRKETKKLYHE